MISHFQLYCKTFYIQEKALKTGLQPIAFIWHALLDFSTLDYFDILELPAELTAIKDVKVTLDAPKDKKK